MHGGTWSRATPGGGIRRAPAEILVDMGCEGIAPLLERAFGAHRVACVDLDALVRDHRAEAAARAVVAVVGSRTPAGTPLELVAERLSEYRAHVGIFACVAGTKEEHARFTAWARASVDRVFLYEGSRFTDCAPFLWEVRARVSAPAPEVAIREVLELLPAGEERAIVLYCLRNGYRQLDVRAVARTFGMPERTMRHRLHRAGVPPCNDLIRAGRHLHITELARRSADRRREMLAGENGFPSAAAWRAAKRRLRRALAEQGPIGQVIATRLQQAP